MISIIKGIDLKKLNVEELEQMVKEIKGAMTACQHISSEADTTVINLQREMIKVWNQLDIKRKT